MVGVPLMKFFKRPAEIYPTPSSICPSQKDFEQSYSFQAVIPTKNNIMSFISRSFIEQQQ
jgi:hypothetical protein